MSWQQLTAFGDDSALPWQLRASIKRLDQGILALDYELVAPADQLIWPAAAASPERRDELWQSTCLELFIAKPNEPRYWEINLSPSGDWNVYRLRWLPPRSASGTIDPAHQPELAISCGSSSASSQG